MRWKHQLIVWQLWRRQIPAEGHWERIENKTANILFPLNKSILWPYMDFWAVFSFFPLALDRKTEQSGRITERRSRVVAYLDYLPQLCHPSSFFASALPFLKAAGVERRGWNSTEAWSSREGKGSSLKRNSWGQGAIWDEGVGEEITPQ